MIPMPLAVELSAIVTFAAFFATLFTMSVYHFLADWRATSTGKRLMIMLALKALLLGLVCSGYIFGRYPGYIELGIIFFAMWAVSIARMGLNILRTQLAVRRKRLEESA